MKYWIGRYEHDATPGCRDSGRYKSYTFEDKEGVRKFICTIDYIQDIKTLIGSRGDQIIRYHSKEDCELIKSGKVEWVEEVLNNGGSLGNNESGYCRNDYYLFLSEEDLNKWLEG